MVAAEAFYFNSFTMINRFNVLGVPSISENEMQNS